ncbi:hypothetical protein CEXT_477281 [Caerostris extrusa]|uniref:Uncharacterized protein n=1 Tax=Caerostris extrusa TaxID=172846 RepID=A0AAV4VEF9_CAEEX|nr:hypothetical protein CEXT_477281 [Caerostris extrusa]
MRQGRCNRRERRTRLLEEEWNGRTSGTGIKPSQQIPNEINGIPFCEKKSNRQHPLKENKSDAKDEPGSGREGGRGDGTVSSQQQQQFHLQV